MTNFPLPGQQHRHQFTIFLFQRRVLIHVDDLHRKRRCGEVRTSLGLPQRPLHVVTEMAVLAGEYRQHRDYYLSPALIGTYSVRSPRFTSKATLRFGSSLLTT